MDIEDFLEYLRVERNYSKLTIEAYGEDLKDFEKYFKSLDCGMSWENVDTDIIRGWMVEMMDKGNNAVSVNRRLCALRSFYRYALSHGLVKTDPAHGITGPKKEKPLPQFVREGEMDKLLDERMWNDTYKDLLARTIILTFYTTGMRLSELTGLNNESVDFLSSQIKVLGKRNKERIIPFGKELDISLKKYVTRRNDEVTSESEAFFLSEDGRRMTSNQVRYIVKSNLQKVCTLKKCTPHVLRHSFATAMLNHDAEIESLKKLLGHQSLETTEIYTHTTFEQLKKIYTSAHPRA